MNLCDLRRAALACMVLWGAAACESDTKPIQEKDTFAAPSPDTATQTDDSGSTDTAQAQQDATTTALDGDAGPTDVAAAVDDVMAKTKDTGSASDAAAADTTLAPVKDASTSASDASDASLLIDAATADILASPDSGATVADTNSDDTASADASADAVKWVTFQIDKAAGPCPPNMNCKWQWIVTSDGNVLTQKQGKAASAKMSAGDFATVDAQLSSTSFFASMSKGFVCGQPPSDIFVSFSLFLDGVLYKQTVTGCVFGNPKGNAAAQVNKIVSAY